VIHAALFPADESGCGFYRMRLPGEHAGVLTTFHERTRLRTTNDLKTSNVVLRYVDVSGADVAVFQRPMDHRLIPVIEQLKKQGVATVVDLDDDLERVDPAHAAYAVMHPSTAPYANWQHLKRACAAADLVTVSTPALARRYGSHGRVVVLPNCVPERLLEYGGEPYLDIAWTGAVGTHPGDLDVVGNAIRSLVDDRWVFGTVGPGEGVPEALGLDPSTVESSGWLSIDEYWRAMCNVGVGIVPLRNSAFNHAKSALKGIEFAALGVPFVASPTPEYQALAALGVGRLATRPKIWRRQIMAAAVEHVEMRERGREVVADRFTIEGQGWRWAEAWEAALKARRAGRGRKVAA
jgi:glycosyltransferase involved in cell wall biosynthesis